MSKKQRIIQTVDCDDTTKELLNIADKTAMVYEQTKDLKAAELALKGYNGAINAKKAQLVYKKLTGSPGVIDFFEE